MKVVYKYALTFPCCEVAMPKAAQILSVQMQQNNMCLWALVDTEQPKELRYLEFHGTGNPFNPFGLVHVATIQEGQFVWHLFERIAGKKEGA